MSPPGEQASPRVPALMVTVVARNRPQDVGQARWRFPPASGRGTSVVLGGDFEPATIIAAYRAGYFPWPHGDEEFVWFSPDPRAVLFPERFHVSRRLARRLRQRRFHLTVNANFAEVIRACADRREGTWITPKLAQAYCELHRMGWAHSIEVWSLDGDLIGGVYGVSIGAMFGAESMFHRATDASKVALAALVQWCARRGIELIDVQVQTPHLASLGAVELPREEYLERLQSALTSAVRFVPPEAESEEERNSNERILDG